MDQFDRAQALEIEEWERRQAEHAQAVYRGASAEFCIECEEPIPEGRRTALPGVELCIECQKNHEKQLRKGRL